MAGRKYTGYGRGSKFAKAAAKQSVQQMKQGVIAKVTPVSGGKATGSSSYVGVGGSYQATPSTGGTPRVEALPQPKQEELKKSFEEQKQKQSTQLETKNLSQQLQTKAIPEQGKNQPQSLKQQLKQPGVTGTAFDRSNALGINKQNDSNKTISNKSPDDQLKGTFFYGGNKVYGVGLTSDEIKSRSPEKFVKPKGYTPSTSRSFKEIWAEEFPEGQTLKEELLKQVPWLKQAGKDYALAHGVELVAPLVGSLYKSTKITRAIVAEKVLPTPLIEKVVSKLPSAVKNIPLGKTATSGSVLTKSLTFGRNLALDVTGAVGSAYGVRKGGLAVTDFTPEEQAIRDKENYNQIRAYSKEEVSKDQGFIKNIISDVPGLKLTGSYKEKYFKELKETGDQLGMTPEQIKDLQSSAWKQEKVEQLSYGVGVAYAGTSSELRGSKYVADKTIKQSTPFLKKWIQFGIPIGKAGVGEGIGTVASYDVSQGNKQDWGSYKPYLRYGTAGLAGFGSAGLIGGVIPVLQTSTNWFARQGGRVINVGANIADPTEFPTDQIAHRVIDPLTKRAGYSVVVPTITMDVSGTKPSIFTDLKNQFKPSVPVDNINQNINPPVQPQKPKQSTKPKTIVPTTPIQPVFPSSNVNVPVTPRTNVPVPVPIPVKPDVPVQPFVPVPEKPFIPVNPRSDVPVQPRSNVPVPVVGAGGIGWGLMLPFGKGNKAKSGKKTRQYGYTPSFSAILLGITAKKQPKPASGYFTGQEIRPIITGKKPKTKKKKKVSKKKKVKKTIKKGILEEMGYNPF